MHPAVTLTLGMAGMQQSGGLRSLGLVPAHLAPSDMAHAQGFTRSPGPCASIRRCGLHAEAASIRAQGGVANPHDLGRRS